MEPDSDDHFFLFGRFFFFRSDFLFGFFLFQTPRFLRALGNCRSAVQAELPAQLFESISMLLEKKNPLLADFECVTS